MDSNKKNKISKFLTYVLRHRPETIDLKLDEYGWANVDEIISKASEREDFTVDDIINIVETCPKQRFRFNENKTMIKANQGHSINIKNDFEKVIPPTKLYHGTGFRLLSQIKKEGLNKMTRHHVHLYGEEHIQKALETGARHDKKNGGVILLIDCKSMVKDNIVFYKTLNDVYLTDNVPSKYITQLM